MERGTKVWIREDPHCPWVEASYEFRLAHTEPLGHHSVMLERNRGRRVVCSCNLSTVEPLLTA